MTTKTLSTSTLSLKFMQNAHRAKNLDAVQLEKAEVKDDGEWEVAKEVRAAWGPETTQSVSYEASFIPFMFASARGKREEDNVDDVPTAKGRRVFKRGKEVATAEHETPAPVHTPSSASSSSVKIKEKQRAKTISGRSMASEGTSKAKGKNKAKSKTAREAVHDSAGVGSDLHQTLQKFKEEIELEPPPPQLPPVFLKPAGVDEPPPPSAPTTHSDPGSGKKQKTKKSKGKREAEGEGADRDDSSGRRKKKLKVEELDG